jgi:hypothetical protein
VSDRGPSLAGEKQALSRMHPRIGDPANQPHRLVARGELTVPIVQVWDHGDPWGCGAGPMSCPLPDGTTVRMGNTAARTSHCDGPSQHRDRRVGR